MHLYIINVRNLKQLLRPQ